MLLEGFPGLLYAGSLVPLLVVTTNNSCLVYDRVEFFHDVRVRDKAPCIHGKLLNVLDVLDEFGKGTIRIPLLLETLLVIGYHDLVDWEFFNGVLQYISCDHHLKSPMTVPGTGKCPLQECILHMILSSCVQEISSFFNSRRSFR